MQVHLLQLCSAAQEGSSHRAAALSRHQPLLVGWQQHRHDHCEWLRARESGKTGLCDACVSSCQPTEQRRRHTSEQSSRVRRAGGAGGGGTVWRCSQTCERPVGASESSSTSTTQPNQPTGRQKPRGLTTLEASPLRRGTNRTRVRPHRASDLPPRRGGTANTRKGRASTRARGTGTAAGRTTKGASTYPKERETTNQDPDL